MQAITVTGPVDAGTLGITLPHEHLLLDLRNQFTDPADPLQRQRSHEPPDAANAAIGAAQSVCHPRQSPAG